METHLPDGTVVETFLDYLDLYLSRPYLRHLFRRPDFSVFSLDASGQMHLISSNARSALNEYNSKLKMGQQDVDYAKALFELDPGCSDRRGIYTVKLADNKEDSCIETRDVTTTLLYRLRGDFRLEKVRTEQDQYVSPS